ncbi:alkene reductase [Mycobacteriaceae bacterium NPDC060252]
MTDLWTPTTVGKMALKHRLAMSAMTRDRALADGTPGPSAPLYYSQRASLGMLITEGAQPSADGQGYLLTPGIYDDGHVRGWRTVAEAVHDSGGHLVIQLMHVGRMSHPDNTPHHRQPVAPSAIAPGVQMFTATGMQDIPVPRALTTQEVRNTIDDFRHAAARAIEAGADAVEVHGANGYLVHQFLAEGANTRTDEYGGTVANRARFAIDVTTAIADEIGPDRTGLRLSPGAVIGGINEGPTSTETYLHVVRELGALSPAYLHLMHLGDEALLREIRQIWPSALLVNRAGRPVNEVSRDIDEGLADVAPVGTWALANPDLPERLFLGADLNEADRATFYGGGDEGYVTYPTLIEGPSGI